MIGDSLELNLFKKVFVSVSGFYTLFDDSIGAAQWRF